MILFLMNIIVITSVRQKMRGTHACTERFILVNVCTVFFFKPPPPLRFEVKNMYKDAPNALLVVGNWYRNTHFVDQVVFRVKMCQAQHFSKTKQNVIPVTNALQAVNDTNSINIVRCLLIFPWQDNASLFPSSSDEEELEEVDVTKVAKVICISSSDPSCT